MAQQRNPLASHKHEIRREFHKQLKLLWKTDRFLSQYRIDPKNPNIGQNPNPAADSMFGWYGSDKKRERPLVEVVGGRHSQFGYRFVPLVTEYFHLMCSLHVLFLRHDIPGSVIQAGDIDNRIKTLIDALRLPKAQNELVHTDAKPLEGEDPFYCLLEDDKLVSGFAVETDTLLETADEPVDRRNVKIVVTVEIRPYYATGFNLSFV